MLPDKLRAGFSCLAFRRRKRRAFQQQILHAQHYAIFQQVSISTPCILKSTIFSCSKLPLSVYSVMQGFFIRSCFVCTLPFFLDLSSKWWRENARVSAATPGDRYKRLVLSLIRSVDARSVKHPKLTRFSKFTIVLVIKAAPR